MKHEIIKDEILNIAQLISNDVYKAVIEHIQAHEHRGFNAHHVAQQICEYAKSECANWLDRNYGVTRYSSDWRKTTRHEQKEEG